MNVLVACEYSGTVRDAFIRKGYHAVSCDILPTERPGPHYLGDVKNILYSRNWDLIIAHPPCTYMSNSGVRWLYNTDGSLNTDRWGKLKEATEFFNLFYTHGCAKVAIENPIPHKHANLPVYAQTIQPYEFGHSTSKRTCLWLKGLPALQPTKLIPKEERTFEIHKAAPGPDRWKIRSTTFQGIADAMSAQWG